MRDEEKTKAQLISELIELRRQISNLPDGETPSELEEHTTRGQKAQNSMRLLMDSITTAFNQSPCPMVINSLSDGCQLAVNDSFLHLTGYSREEFLGHDHNHLNLLVNTNEYTEIIKKLKDQGSVQNREICFRSKAGDIYYGLISATIVSFKGRRCVLTALMDITERKHMEMNMARLDGLHLVGEMAAIISHEIRNPLTTVRGFLQILGGKGEMASHLEYFNLMIDELDRANSIIEEYLSLAKSRTFTKKMVSLNGLVEVLLPLIQADAENAGKHVRLDLEDLPDLLMDENEVRRLVFNLVRNGLEAMLPGGTLTIRTFMENGEIVMAIMDEGAGIEPGLLEKIGKPFFTTKEKGTGLG